MAATTIVRAEVTETQFGLYSDEELRNLSVCKVVSPLARDALGNALSGGLYDPRMGATEHGANCVTCGLHQIQCPGHPGHIELDFPCYHPLLFGDLFNLVRSSCFCCHKIRMSGTRLWVYLAKLQLLEMDDLDAAANLDDRLLPSTILDDDETTTTTTTSTTSDKPTSGVKATLAKQKAIKEKVIQDMQDILEEISKRYKTFIQARLKLNNSNSSTNSKSCSMHAKKLQRVVIKDLTSTMTKVKRCENCGEWSPNVRKDSHAKLFAKPLPKKYRNRSAMNKALYGGRTALEELRSLDNKKNKHQNIDETNDDDDDVDNTMQQDASDDDDDDDDDVEVEGDIQQETMKETDNYLVPLEVEAIMKLLWRYHADILDFVWSRASRSIQQNTTKTKFGPNVHGWKTFFMRVVCVTPNRFRPEAHIGDATSEHPQNKNLAKVIENNEAISALALKHRGIEKSQTDMNNQGGSSLRDLIANGGPNKAAPTKVEIPISTSGKVEMSFLSQSVYLWSQLQISVNCYMDSAKDPNVLSNTAPAGIRQLLEKKEGMFRMNMMGKRVNYCCRSVISPDPYIGQNEIGIPVKFAKTLHYPTPVNEWNVKHLRTLVERGPDQYPGKCIYLLLL
jgi:DNA-directed RNA polymerase I subunit RPA1